MNSGQLDSQRRTIAGYFLPQVSANSRNRVVAASSVGAVQMGLSALAILSQSCRAAYRNDARSR